jgi:general stress protein 26
MDPDLRTTILEILDECHDMTVATVRPDGWPQATVVSFAHDGLGIYFGCGSTAQKAANIARDPRVSLALTAPYEDWRAIRGLSVAAVAHEVTAADEIERVVALMTARFPQLAGMEVAGVPDMKLFRLRPEIVSVLDYRKGFGHTDLVRIGADDIAESLETMRHRWLVPEG